MLSRDIKTCPVPPRSFLGKDGSRYIKVYFDVMRGGRFVKQVSMLCKIHLELGLFKYMTDLSLEEMAEQLFRTYPSLKGSDLLPTVNRVIS